MTQFSIFMPSILEKWATLLVTIIKSFSTAAHPISKSKSAIGVPLLRKRCLSEAYRHIETENGTTLTIDRNRSMSSLFSAYLPLHRFPYSNSATVTSDTYKSSEFSLARCSPMPF